MQRVTASTHWATFLGYVAITLGVLFAVCAVVGVAVVFAAIAEMVRT